MEAIVRPVTWEEWPEQARPIFEAFRSPAGEEMVIEKNLFVEAVLTGSMIRDLTEEEKNEYRRPFLVPEHRRPTLTWPREIPLDGEPADVVQIVSDYAEWISESDIPKLFINADPGAILTGSQREFCRSWPNQTEITVVGNAISCKKIATWKLVKQSLTSCHHVPDKQIVSFLRYRNKA